MKKSDLKNGMVVDFENGIRAMFLQNGFIGKNGASLLHFHHVKEDLTTDLNKIERYDIVRVFEINKDDDNHYSLKHLFENRFDELKLIWEREKEDETPTKDTPQLTLVEARDIDGNDWNLVQFIAIDEKSGIFICKELYSGSFMPYKGYKYCRIHQHTDID